MARRKIGAGLTSLTLPVSVKDTSSTTGGGLSGLTSATSGLVCEYRRQGQSAWTAVTLSAGTLGTWSSGGFVADGSQAGDYEMGLPDAAVAGGARWVIVRLRGAANMYPVRVEIELDSINYQDSVRLGLTALPNATAGDSGGLPTGDASGRVTVGSNADKTGYTASTVSDKSGYSGAATNLPADYLSTAEQTFLARLDTTVSSRMATFTYTAPTNPADYARSNVAPDWWVSPDNADVATALSDLVSLLARTDPTTALGTLQIAANAIRSKTDLLTFTGGNVNAAISGDATTTLYGDAGAITYTYTVYDVGGVTPLAGAAVYVSADVSGSQRSQTKVTDSLGRVTFQLDAGTVYFWMSHPDRTFSGAVSEVVS